MPYPPSAVVERWLLQTSAKQPMVSSAGTPAGLLAWPTSHLPYGKIRISPFHGRLQPEGYGQWLCVQVEVLTDNVPRGPRGSSVPEHLYQGLDVGIGVPSAW